MTQLTLAIRQPPPSEQVLHWQMSFNAAFASGSLNVALLNLGTLIAYSLVRSALARLAPALREEEHNA